MEIYFSDKFKIFFEEQYNHDCRINFIIKASLRKFSGEHSFCVLIHDLEIFKKNIDQMLSGEFAEAIIRDQDSLSFFYVSLDTLSTVTIRGNFGIEYGDNNWTFQTTVDRTILSALSTSIRRLLQLS